jgi:Alpha/beta hydrolase family
LSETAERLHTLKLPQGSDGRVVTYISDLAIDGPHPGIARAVLVVHGIKRDGDRYWRALARAARRAGPGIHARTYLLAPQFFTRGDLRERDRDPGVLAWKARDWKEGGSSRAGDVSSFDALDALLARLADRTSFPDLRTVVLAGHSAGAQLLQRHAAASAAGDGLARAGVATRYVVINPSSYLYLDATRPGFGPDGGFAVPPPARLAACPAYDDYKYGLRKPIPILAPLAAEEIKARYGSRQVVYLVAGEDDDPNDESLDRSCAAMMQGRTRLERGHFFQQHLANIYGEAIRDRHVLTIVPGLGHEGAKILRSPSGLRWIFDVVQTAPGVRANQRRA